MGTRGHHFDSSAITRPDPKLMTYYFILALGALPAFPVALLGLYLKYRTMRFRFDDEGVWRGQGLLWRREVNVAYRRIQDIHLTSGFVQRWLGLATVSIQTAAGSATPEITIEGVLEAEALRDFLYSKMRGVRDGSHTSKPGTAESRAATGDAPEREALVLLTDIRDALRRLEQRLDRAGRDA